MIPYTSQILAEDEYLLKLRKGNPDTGYLTKLNKNGTIPKTFLEWGIQRYHLSKEIPLPIYVFKEEYNCGWLLRSWRFGQSQNWATLIHPKGFTLEIYLQQFLEIAQNNMIINGEIIGEFKWEANKLIKKID